MFAGVVRDGGFLEARVDPAQPERKPLPRPDLRLRLHRRLHGAADEFGGPGMGRVGLGHHRAAGGERGGRVSMPASRSARRWWPIRASPRSASPARAAAAWR
jgi:hypothetical protein